MSAVTLGELGRADVAEWSDGRLRLWCRHVPLILLSAIEASKRPPLDDLPGRPGGYTLDDIESVAGLRATAQVERYGATGWGWLCRWALSTLYPEYRRRMGKAHPCDERTVWLAIACAPVWGEEW